MNSNLSTFHNNEPGRSISPQDLTVGTFECTPHWGMTESMVCREGYYADREKGVLQRGVLVFQPDVSKFLDARDERSWRPEDIILVGPKLTCTFSMAEHWIRVDFLNEGLPDREFLPCVLVHDFMSAEPKNELERLFNI